MPGLSGVGVYMGSGDPRSFVYGPLIASVVFPQHPPPSPPTKTRASTQPPITPKNDTCVSSPHTKPSCVLQKVSKKRSLRHFSGKYIDFSFFLTPS